MAAFDKRLPDLCEERKEQFHENISYSKTYLTLCRDHSSSLGNNDNFVLEKKLIRI